MPVDRHRLKLLGYDFTVIHEPGKLNPCDYASRHPIPLDRYMERELEKLAVAEEVEMHVNRVITHCLPEAVNWEMIARETNRDPIMARLKESIIKGRLGKTPNLKPYEKIFEELTVARQLILFGERILVPEGLRADIIALA